jgi:uncharacterized protein YfiM (DUF2279 family)
MESAIKNLRKDIGQQISLEGGYLVKPGSFARDFGRPPPDGSPQESEYQNPSAYTFPLLFPYGVGGLEDARSVSVSFTEHARWCLQHYDNRFRKHFMFTFWVLTIEQKRQALNAARLTMTRQDFDRFSAALSILTPEDLIKASEEEEKGLISSDPKIRLLRRVVQVAQQKVMGSDASQALNRSKIWSTSLYLNPMNLWMTLNLVDRHDPICQVFAGKDIDMENLAGVLGLSAQERAQTVAEDPYAATQFFFFLANTILETLFGFAIKSRAASNAMGALGLGNAYFGAIEAQGRGSLHLHLVMWLQNSPNAEEINVKLKSQEFRDKIKAYLRANIRAHLDNLTEDVLVAMEPDHELAWSRPPHPDSPTFHQDWCTLEAKLARSQQYHKCTPNTCLVYNKRKKCLTCKRRAPFELSEVDDVKEDGTVLVRRSVKQLNSWCPTVFYGGRCNNDIKLVTNGSDARSISWYITNYVTKKQGNSFNRSAVLSKTYERHKANCKEDSDARKLNQLFVFRCGLSLNREMEYSSQQASAYVMGLGDTIKSHFYAPIYWSSVVRALKKTYPELDGPVSKCT